MSKYDFWDELGRIFNAVVAYQEKTVEFNDRFITPWIKMGNVFDKQDRNKEAVSAYQNAIVIDPLNAKNWFELGNIYFQMSDFESAADAYKKAAELSPDSGWAHSNLALTLASQGKYEESIPLYQMGIALLDVDKDKAVVWNRLGNAYRKLNNYEQAMSAFTEADKFDSENAGFRDELDEVSDGPGIIEAAGQEGQNGSEVVDLIQAVLETEQELEDASQGMGIDPELNADSQNADVQIVSEEVTVMDVDPQPELTLEADLQTQEDAVTEEIPSSDLQNDLVEVTEAINEDVVEIDAVQEMEADAPAAIFESVDEIGQDFENDLDAEDVAQSEPDAQSNSAEPVAQRSILEIVEAVIAKVLAESEDGKETPVELETVPEQPVLIEEVTEVIESPVLSAEEQNESDETVVAAAEQVISDSSPELETETLDQPVVAAPELNADDQLEAESLEETVDTTAEDPGHDEALELIAQNTSETFTDNLFVTSTETDTSDASIFAAESKDELSSEPQVEADALEIPVAEQGALADPQAASVNVAYEEYLNDNNGHFKISVNESGQEGDSGQDSFLPAELLAKIDLAGDVQIETDAKSAHVWNELGNVYFNSGAYEDAVIAYSKSIELDRQFAWPYSNLALVYVQKGRFAEAMLLYQRSIELFSNDKDKAISWNRLGNVYRRVSDYDNAISAYQRADELDTDNTTLSLQSRFSLLGNYYMEKKTSYAA